VSQKKKKKEEEIVGAGGSQLRMIAVRSQPGQIVLQDPISKTPFT
jgi:hypothetical protein